MEFCEFLKGIDFFGKEPEFYIKGRPKQITFIGRIFTTIFIIIYIIILCYKFYRMSQRVDITFYDSYSNTEEIPIIKITKENFSLFFSLFDDLEEPFIDESIYYPVAYFYDEETEQIKIERCDPNKIGDKFKDLFENSEINNYYCLNDVNYLLKPYINTLQLQILPCKNTSENNDSCKPKEIIDEYLNNMLFLVYFKDILLTPLDFNSPVKEKINTLETLIFKNVGQLLYTEMQLVKIETSTNIIGFDFLTNPKVDYFIKFDNVEIIPYPGYNLDDEDNDYPIVLFEFQLNDKILFQKRQYIQLIDVLGEVGGFMEIIYSFFGLICSLFVDILYEKTIANNLFSFNLQKKLILIKQRKNPIYKINNHKIKDDKNNNSHIIFPLSIKKNKDQKKILIMETMNKDININDKNSENYLINKKNLLESNSFSNEMKVLTYDTHSVKNSLKNLNNNKIQYSLNQQKYNNDKNFKNEILINKIGLKDIFIPVCLYYLRQKRKIYKILLKESMNIMIEKLDIFNVFKNICSIEYINDYNNNHFNEIKMTEECSNNIFNISKE